MRVYYCRKCKTDSAAPICEHCGMQITALQQNERFKWQASRLPLGDATTVLGVLRTLSLILVLLAVILFLGELFFSPDKQTAVSLFVSSGLVPRLLILFALSAAAALLVLGLQGREELHYEVNHRGAHLQVWIAPSRLRCLARCIPYDPYSIVRDREGVQHMKVGETHILWEDVMRYVVRKRAGRIELYHPAGYRFLTLYPEQEEMDALVQYMTPRMKQLVSK